MREMTDVQRALVEQVRFLLAMSGLSQADLAQRVGLSEKHVSQMLTGKVEGSLSAWQRLMDGGKDAVANVHQAWVAAQRMEAAEVCHQAGLVAPEVRHGGLPPRTGVSSD